MSKSTAPTLKKKGGGFKAKRRDKRKSESIDVSIPLQIGTEKKNAVRTLGGHEKLRLLKIKSGNLFDAKSKTFSKVELIKVIENKANRSYARRNIITKGCIIETSGGNAVVVNRPGQSSQITLRKV
ncbi:MAG: 30S ribosomal protein S8e [Candidatus Parvarchaeota archaeon]|jgi:small subunit ribosomal protein S8e|nr:30S ribosomal protein S8e [Candidatus Parvarchaeota archaeon]MCL5101163.1 30S ribosomal protein S8e [Candidatus Parvarchaeota archaeon]